MAFLRHVRADTLQAAFISHPDLDHFGALSALLREFPVKKVYLPSGSNPTPAWLGLLRDLDAFEGRLDTLFVGDTLIWDGGIKVRVLWPEPHSTLSANDQSTVLRIEYEDRRILLTGDIEDAAESALVDQETDLRANILKVAHHGSRTSSGLRFVAEARPRWAVISCDSTVYGHPHKEALADLALVMGDSARILKTDREGTVGFELDGDGVRRIDAWE
jgi:competence protein ComEC